MVVYGSGTGRVAITFSNHKQLYSPVWMLWFLFSYLSIYPELFFKSMNPLFQAHWIVKLVSMLSLMTLLVRGLLLVKQTRQLKCGKRTKMLPLKLTPSTSSHQKISDVSRPLFLRSVIPNTIFRTNLRDLVYENFGRLHSLIKGLNIFGSLHVFSQLKLVALICKWIFHSYNVLHACSCSESRLGSSVSCSFGLLVRVGRCYVGLLKLSSQAPVLAKPPE